MNDVLAPVKEDFRWRRNPKNSVLGRWFCGERTCQARVRIGVRIPNTQGNARARDVWQSACNCNQKSDIRDPWSKLASQTPRICELWVQLRDPVPMSKWQAIKEDSQHQAWDSTHMVTPVYTHPHSCACTPMWTCIYIHTHLIHRCMEK